MIISSISKCQEVAAAVPTRTTHANDELRYITYGQTKSRLTYIEKLRIAPLYFEVEINIKADEESNHADGEGAGEANLTLNSIARSTNSGE